MGNPIVHWELMVTDLEKAKRSTRRFDWKFDESTYPGYHVDRHRVAAGRGDDGEARDGCPCAPSTPTSRSTTSMPR